MDCWAGAEELELDEPPPPPKPPPNLMLTLILFELDPWCTWSPCFLDLLDLDFDFLRAI